MTCPHCGCVFCVDNWDVYPDAPYSPKIYCSTACKYNAKKKRSKRVYERQVRCFRQGKVRYPNAKAAEASIEYLNTRFGHKLTQAYQCGDHWHLTSQPPNT